MEGRVNKINEAFGLGRKRRLVGWRVRKAQGAHRHSACDFCVGADIDMLFERPCDHPGSWQGTTGLFRMLETLESQWSQPQRDGARGG